MNKYCSTYSIEIEVPVDLDDINDELSALLQEESIEDDASKAEQVARIKLWEVLKSMPFDVVNFDPKYTEKISYLEDAEDVEKEIELQVVATMSLPYRNRQVVKLPDLFALRMFLKDFGRPDIASTIEDTCPIPDCSFYLVRDFEGESGIEILPKWAFEHGSFCSVYDASYEDEIKSTQMPVSEAVLELLK